ncbi:BapA/Bap/LapF family large adhesin [Brucella cytisi]|uniref:BapA/Bap/LapF family large adhesin n=1 Tax=Brucella cytisi TaxID=407152 RepID=UPI00142D515C|nr:BapA/Bap/LapF family large adhesin [Brucella cytisi]
MRQTDGAGNTSLSGSLGAVTIAALEGANDTADVDMGGRESTAHAPVTDENLQLLGLLDDGSNAAGVAFTVAAGSSGDVTIEVSQSALIAVADAFNVEVYDADGNLVQVLTTGNDPLVGDVAGVGLLGLTGDNTLVANITGLEPGDYTVVVRKGESALGSLLDADGDGVSLEELGQGGVVLGAENQALVLDAVETALNGEILPGIGLPLGTVVVNILEPILDTTTAIGAGQLVEVLSTALGNLGLTGSLDTVLGAVAEALLSNTLTLIQDTSVTVSLTEHSFVDGDTPVSGNVIDPDGAVTGEAGEDTIVPGTEVTQVAFSDGTVVQLVDGSATIDGAFGTLVINADGSYTYTPNGDTSSVGQSEVFTYTISDGTNSVEANLSINLDGELVADDTALAGVEYDYVVTPGESIPDAVEYSWVVSIPGLPPVGTGSLVSSSFEVEANTTQDITLTVDAGSLLGLGTGVVLYVEMNDGEGNWGQYAIYNTSQLLSLLGSGGVGDILVPDLPIGEYRVRMEVDTGLSLAGAVSVDIASSITHLDEYTVSDTFVAEGNLFDNDLIGTELPPLSVSGDGTTFLDVVEGASQVVQGNYGALEINADGSYTYTPDDRATAGGDFTDTFTYRIEHNGVYQEATLTVNVNTTIQGEETDSGTANVAFLSTGDDVVPMNELTTNGDEQFAHHDQSEILQESIVLDDGSGEITLPTSESDVGESGSPTTLSSADTASVAIGEGSVTDDPLAYLTPDPLAQEDQVHTAHVV